MGQVLEDGWTPWAVGPWSKYPKTVGPGVQMSNCPARQLDHPLDGWTHRLKCLVLLPKALSTNVGGWMDPLHGWTPSPNILGQWDPPLNGWTYHQKQLALPPKVFSHTVGPLVQLS